MSNIMESFGSLVFDDRVMRQRLPKDTYKALKKTIEDGKSLDKSIAGTVANAMKDWAVAKGVTHYTHWFQPMTGITAEKHDSFIANTSDMGVIMEFSGKELIQGEPDASSFPNGGLRTTFEARGYTSWDATSYAFIKDNVLCIPTAFCSYGGEALDKKTPLLRSMEALNRQALRILRLFGDESTRRVTSTAGAEQEYFLVDRKVYEQRKDLKYCARTLFGARPPKCQEMDDHYFGTIKPRVHAFMKELDEELWKLGILAKTEHNEVAPSQHELAPLFTTVNIATDQNQIIMETMKKVARRHDFACILHEKPFAYVNGSGKHDNWSINTADGRNLLNPGDSPRENAQFLLFLIATISAVDKHQDLLRISVASAGNDLRLGGNEAPPSVISVFVGDELESVLNSIEQNTDYDKTDRVEMRVGVHTLPRFFKDTTDRNRTSPFAFTGNRFEFRMVGSSSSISCPNLILNTIVADELMLIADKLEASDDMARDLNILIRDMIKEHKHIIFNGNNYSEEWRDEAARRGLVNLPTAADAIPHYTDKKNVELFGRHRVFSESELHSRSEILLEEYCKTIAIESRTMVDMVQRSILPACLEYESVLLESVSRKKNICDSIPFDAEKSLIKKISALCDSLYDSCTRLQQEHEAVMNITDAKQQADKYKGIILPLMDEVRSYADELETLVSEKYWPFPTYGELLFSH